jgi:hypothetical protein
VSSAYIITYTTPREISVMSEQLQHNKGILIVEGNNHQHNPSYEGITKEFVVENTRSTKYFTSDC